MKSSVMTRHIRHMRKFGNCCNYVMASFDYTIPSGGGGIAAEKDLFANPALIFKWIKHRETIKNSIKPWFSDWMKQYISRQCIWIERTTNGD